MLGGTGFVRRIRRDDQVVGGIRLQRDAAPRGEGGIGIPRAIVIDRDQRLPRLGRIEAVAVEHQQRIGNGCAGLYRGEQLSARSAANRVNGVGHRVVGRVRREGSALRVDVGAACAHAVPDGRHIIECAQDRRVRKRSGAERSRTKGKQGSTGESGHWVVPDQLREGNVPWRAMMNCTVP